MMTDPAASRPGTHLDPDRLADLFDGLLDPAAAEEARAHLASCPLCSSDFALIAGETDLDDLAGLLPPEPIPADVVTRVEAALHREPPLVSASAPAPASHAVQPPRRRFRLAITSLAGAALVIVGGIGVFTAVNNSDSSSKSSSASNSVAGGSMASQPGATAGARPGDDSPGRGPGNATPHVGTVPDTVSPPTSKFSNLTIEQQAQILLGQHTMTPANGTSSSGQPQCTPSGVAAGTQLLASGQTNYDGRQAWLLIYAESGTAAAADVYVVDVDSCTSGNSPQAVYHTVVARP